eukprot:scaffold27929_cov176-Amphora_coffeaeformis.AAC.2
MYSCLRGFLGLGGVHGQRVHESTGNSNGRTNDTSGTHGCLKCHNRSNDDDNTLNGVTDGMGDGVDLAQRQKGHFIVGIVRGSTEGQERCQRLGRPIGSGSQFLKGSNETGSFQGQHGGDQNERRHGR